MRVNSEIRGPLMNVGNYLVAVSAYLIILMTIAFVLVEIFLPWIFVRS